MLLRNPTLELVRHPSSCGGAGGRAALTPNPAPPGHPNPTGTPCQRRSNFFPRVRGRQGSGLDHRAALVAGIEHVFAETPGKANCHGTTVSALARKFQAYSIQSTRPQNTSVLSPRRTRTSPAERSAPARSCTCGAGKTAGKSGNGPIYRAPLPQISGRISGRYELTPPADERGRLTAATPAKNPRHRVRRETTLQREIAVKNISLGIFDPARCRRNPDFLGGFPPKTRSVLRNRQGIPRLSRVSSRARSSNAPADVV